MIYLIFVNLIIFEKSPIYLNLLNIHKIRINILSIKKLIIQN
jgi:hypothetical protein